MFHLFKNFIYGIVFGLTLIIPGVSGGTLAIILGFYQQLIEAVNNFTKGFNNFVKHIKFLIPFGLGIVISIVAFASVIQFLFRYYSFPAMMFFIGLIAGVLPSMYSQSKGERISGRVLDPFRLRDIVTILIPVGLLVLTSHIGDGMVMASPTDMVIDAPFMLFLFVIGIIAAASLLVPGLSGSFVLLVAGVYPVATYAVSSIRMLVTDITNVEVMMGIVRILAPLGVGIIIGILLMARLVERLLKKRSRAVYLVVTGLMIGSIYVLAVDPILFYSGVNEVVVAVGVAACLVGVVVSYKMGSTLG